MGGDSTGMSKEYQYWNVDKVTKIDDNIDVVSVELKRKMGLNE